MKRIARIGEIAEHRRKGAENGYRCAADRIQSAALPVDLDSLEILAFLRANRPDSCPLVTLLS
jgi:hypothetical protein